MGTWSIDMSRWPIVVHSVDGSITDAQVDEYVSAATKLLLKGQTHVAILDATRAGQVSAYTRSRTMDFQREYRSELREHCLGTVYVLGSPLLRFIVMTVV